MTTRPDASTPEQPQLPGLARAAVRRRGPARAAPELATDLPVARVLVDVGLAHLDREFDYSVPAAMAETARPGVRVKVRFAGKDADGFVVARVATTDHTGALSPLRRVVSAEPVLSPAVAALSEALAARYAGTRWDLLRLAVPPRHATTEKVVSPPEEPPEPLEPATTADDPSDGWAHLQHGSAYVARLRAGASPRAVASVPPGDDWPALLAQAVAACHTGGRGVIVCLPDGKDVARLDAALVARIGTGHHVTLGAGAGPARRYREFLAVARGTRRIVLGTRSAAFAPVHDLGLLVIWDDGDDLHAEPRAPYPHTREVLLLRAEQEGAAMLLAGFARSVEATYLLRTGWAREISATRAVLRERVTVEVVGGDQDLRRDLHAMTSRFPQQAHRLVRDALTSTAAGPVLVQTPRHGYVTSLACDRCRTPARCSACTGPLALAGATAPPACRWCGTPAPGWSCTECGGHGLRAPVLGDLRTAEELGRAFPGTRVRSSSGDTVLASVGPEPALVVATPGAEPVAEDGYAAVVLLDTWLLLSRVDLRAEEEALRRWSNAVGLVRAGGRAIAVGDPGQPALQALVRWDQPGFAERETRERQLAHLPPASRLATITGSPGAVDDAVTLLSAPAALEVLGPVALGDPSRQESRVVLRVPRARATELSGALVELQRVRAARKLDAVRVQVDPPSL